MSFSSSRVITLILLVAFGSGAGGAPPSSASDEDGIPRITPVVRAYRRAAPAVVNITAERVITTRYGLGGFRKDPFADIFPAPFTRRVPVRSLGSGFLIHPDGYLVTNAHVIRHAQDIAVTFGEDDEPLPARVISADPEHDLAVLKIDPPEDEELPYLPLGRSDDLMVGETVIAIGNPMGYTSTLTTGVISGTDRTLDFGDGKVYRGLIQTDTPINPGNSGGPLLNIRGELIGVNTAIRADAQNIGFAISVDALASELTRLLDYERMNRITLGAAVRQVHTDDGDRLEVAEVRPGTPAADVLRAGDEITSLNGEEIEQIPGFVCGMLGVRAEETVRLGRVRDGEEEVVSVTVEPKPRPDGNELARRLLGLSVRPVTPALARRLGLRATRGLLVVGVQEGAPGHRIGLELKDILFQVDRYYVTDTDDLGMALENVAAGDVVRVGFLRGRQAVWVPIRAGGAEEEPEPRAPRRKLRGRKGKP